MEYIEIPALLVLLTSWLAVTWGIFRLFKEIGDSVNNETKTRVSHWLLNVKLENRVTTLPDSFGVLFDNFFSENHFSRKCILRSSLVTLLVSLILIGVLFVRNQVYIFESKKQVEFVFSEKNSDINIKLSAIRKLIRDSDGNEIIDAVDLESLENVDLDKDNLKVIFLKAISNYNYFRYEEDRIMQDKARLLLDHNHSLFDLENSKVSLSNVSYIIFAVLLFNLFVDFLSLLQTRYFINLMKESSSLFVIILLSLLDFLITAMIFLFFFTLVQVFFGYNYSVNDLLGSMKFLSSDHYWAVPLFTTFFTSIWLWLYVSTSFMIRLFSLPNRGHKFIVKYLDVINKPFRSIGLVLIFLISLIYVGWFFKIYF